MVNPSPNINLHLDVDIKSLPEKDARQKIDDMNFIAERFRLQASYDVSLYCSENALLMAKEINYVRGTAGAKRNIGEVQYMKAEYKDAKVNLTEAAKLYAEINDRKSEGKTYINLAISHRYLDDYTTMIELCFKALYIFREVNDESSEGYILAVIGNYYLEVREYPLSIEYYLMALHNQRKHKTIGRIILIVYNLGLAYYNLGLIGGDDVEKKYYYEKSLKYYNEALNFNLQIDKRIFLKHRILRNIAITYSQIGKYDEGEKILLESLTYFTSTKNKIEICETLNELSELYLRKGDYEKAEETLTQGEKSSIELESKRLELAAMWKFHELYKLKKDFKKAIKYSKRAAFIEFERNNTLVENNIRKLSVIHTLDIAKKETEILSENNIHLKSLNDELLKLNNERNYFLSVAANDLKIPLENISHSLNDLRKPDIQSEYKLNVLNTIMEHSSGMQEIISDLLKGNERQIQPVSEKAGTKINLHLNVDITTLSFDEAIKKIDDVNFLAQHFITAKNFETASYCAENAFEMAVKREYARGIAFAKTSFAVISYEKKDFVTAIPQLVEAEKLLQNVSELKEQGKTCYKLALSYWNISDYHSQIEYLFKALNIFRENKNESEEGNILNSIGNYYLEINEYNSALEYYKMSLNHKKKYIDVIGTIMTLYNIALTYNNIEANYDISSGDENYVQGSAYNDALKYYNKALEINSKLEKSKFLEMRIKQNIGLTLTNIKRDQEAVEIFLNAIEYYDETENELDKCDTLVYLAEAYRHLGKTEKSYENFLKAKEIAERLDIKRLISVVHRDLTRFYLGQKDYKNAFLANKKYSELHLEKIRTISENDIRKLNILHKVDVAKKETEALAEQNENLKSLNEKLVEMNEEKSYFMSVAAKELKLPLEKISDMIADINIDAKDKKLKKLSGIIQHSSSMQGIISELLTINELEITA